MHTYIHKCMHAYIHTYMHTYLLTYIRTRILTRQSDRQTDTPTDRRIDRQTHRPTNGQTDTQTDGRFWVTRVHRHTRHMQYLPASKKPSKQADGGNRRRGESNLDTSRPAGAPARKKRDVWPDTCPAQVSGHAAGRVQTCDRHAAGTRPPRGRNNFRTRGRR